MLEPTGPVPRLKVTIAAISMAAILVGLTVAWAFGPISAGSREVREFTVQPGWGTARIAGELASAGLIRSAVAFTAYTRFAGLGASLQAGTYELSRGMTPVAIARRLASGEALSTDTELTIPEGMNAWEIDELLQTKKLIVPGSFARTWQEAEGTLFPETYRIPREVASAGAEFANARRIGDILRAEYDRRAGGYTREQVIIASMLEKEAKTPEDMALVAGIIAKRRDIGMLLQIDATVAYGWCLRRWLPMSSTANCDVTQAPIATEIKVDGPYNTYTRAGLPDGPISNPGARALEAAKNPKASDYLYYLSTRDGSDIIFSKTLDEHLQNRAKYLSL